MRVIGMSDISGKGNIRKDVIDGIRGGKVFFYPTDTLYGLGCDATNPEAVRRIRDIKTSSKPFSVIAPSKDWIREKLEVRMPEHLERLPGPYTLIFRMKSRAVCSEVSTGKLGVRIPDHPFTGIVQEAGVPFVTTSANVSGETPVWNIEGMPKHIEKKVDFAVDDGIIKNPPSGVIDLSSPGARVLR